jgi:hypothetical protein
MKKAVVYISLLLISLFTLTSCSDSASPNENGRIKMYLVDAPATLESVFLEVVQVEVHSADNGWLVINDVPQNVDLLTLTNGVSALLGDEILPVGTYTQVRLILGDDNYLYDNGVRYDLEIPSGQQSGLKFIHPFNILPDNLYELYLDFNADKSIVLTGSGQYHLKPTVRLQAAVISGTISGKVEPLDADAVISTFVGEDEVATYTDDEGYFKLMCLPEGTYDVTVTPANEAYKVKVVEDVVVTKQTDNDLGTITLENN